MLILWKLRFYDNNHLFHGNHGDGDGDEIESDGPDLGTSEAPEKEMCTNYIFGVSHLQLLLSVRGHCY